MSWIQQRSHRVLSVLGGMTAVVWAIAGVVTVSAAPQPAGPTHRELWVPERSLAAALTTMPKAVLLTREQFASLLRDSAVSSAANPSTPPAPAVLRSARYTGSLGERAALMSAEFVVDGLGDTWTELPLSLDPRWLGSATVDGTAAVSATEHAAVLVVRGAGRHVVRLDFAAPVVESAGSRTLVLRAPGTVEATLVLSVPESVHLESALPFRLDQGKATFALPAGMDDLRIHWTARDVPPLDSSGLFQDCRFLYSLDAAQVRADLSLVFHGALKSLPHSVALPLPTGAQVLAVTGTELARWSLADDQLLAEFLPGDRRQSDLRVQVALPVDDETTRLTLPAPVAGGMHRASGTFTLLSHDGLRVRQVTTGALTARDDSLAAAEVSTRPDFRGTWAFPVLVQAPVVEIERLSSRFTATLDTQVSLTRDAVRFTRHLAFHPRDGTLFSPRVTALLAGEEIDSVTLADGGAIDWRRSERGLTLTTPAGTAPGHSLSVVVTSSLRPDGWNQLTDQAIALALTSAELPGAEKVSGYVTVDFDESLRVTTPKTDGLEARDPRQFTGKLPLTGRLAWFRLDAFQLDLAVSRRPVEFDAAINLDVLPLLNSLEIEGQLALAVAHGGLREVTVAFPMAMAGAVRWDSPLIAEKSMTDDGRWVLKFHQEMTGAPFLRFHASLPLTDAAPEGGRERRFSAQVPFPLVDTARRSSGTLVVEANSDTELAFAPQALDDLDTRDAPVIDGYAPLHRLVAAYSWRGGAPALAIDGVRHRPGDLASTVVDSLRLDSVISEDGPTRHQAVLALRSAGTQFMDLTLPDHARVLSVVIDGLAAKPIRGPAGTVRLPLTGSNAELSIIYETPAEPMSSLGHTTLPALTLDAQIPVLKTTWRVHLPDGFSYSAFDSNLIEEHAPAPPPTLAQAVINAPMIAEIFSRRHSGVVVMEISRSSGAVAGDFYDPASGSKAALSSSWYDLPTEQAIATSRESLAPVVTRLGLVDRWKHEVSTLDQAVEKLARMVRLEDHGGSDLVRLEVRSGDESEAAELANAVAHAYSEQRQAIERDRVTLGFETLSHTRKAQEQEVESARDTMLAVVQELGIEDLHASTRFRSFNRGSESTSHENIEEPADVQQDVRLLDPAKYAKYAEAKTRYTMASDILEKMIDEQERARVVNLMPRKPVIIHEAAAMDGTPGGERTTTFGIAAQSALADAKTPRGAVQVTLTLPQPGTPESQAIEGFVTSPDETTPVAPPLESSSPPLANREPATAPQADGPAVAAAAIESPPAQQQVGGPGGSGGDAPGTRPAVRAGLLPLAFSLPEGGRTVTFSGNYAPSSISFRAEAWDRQVRRAWLWMLAGGVSFTILNRRFRRPVFFGILGALGLHFAPLLASRPDWTPIANALLTGWLVALGIAAIIALVRWTVRHSALAEEVAHG